MKIQEIASFCPQLYLVFPRSHLGCTIVMKRGGTFIHKRVCYGD